MPNSSRAEWQMGCFPFGAGASIWDHGAAPGVVSTSLWDRDHWISADSIHSQVSPLPQLRDGWTFKIMLTPVEFLDLHDANFIFKRVNFLFKANQFKVDCSNAWANAVYEKVNSPRPEITFRCTWALPDTLRLPCSMCPDGGWICPFVTWNYFYTFFFFWNRNQIFFLTAVQNWKTLFTFREGCRGHFHGLLMRRFTFIYLLESEWKTEH